MFETVRDAEGLVGVPLDSSALTIYGRKHMVDAMRDRLMTHAELEDLPVKLIKKLAEDLAEEAVQVAAQMVFESRLHNSEIIHYRRSVQSEGPKWVRTGK